MLKYPKEVIYHEKRLGFEESKITAKSIPAKMNSIFATSNQMSYRHISKPLKMGASQDGILRSDEEVNCLMSQSRIYEGQVDPPYTIQKPEDQDLNTKSKSH